MTYGVSHIVFNTPKPIMIEGVLLLNKRRVRLSHIFLMKLSRFLPKVRKPPDQIKKTRNGDITTETLYS